MISKNKIGTLAVSLALATTAVFSAQPVAAMPTSQPVVAAAAESAPNPQTCEGYPEKRVFIEQQAWWMDATGEAFPGRHVHVGACWPLDIVTGTVSVDVRVILHSQPVTSRLFRVRISDGGRGNVATDSTGLGVPDANGDQTLWTTLTFSTSGMFTGIHEMRLAAYVHQSEGIDQFVSGGLPLYVRSKSGGDTSRNYYEGRGWYERFNYDNARFRSVIPTAALTGIWKPVIGCANPSGRALTACNAYIDPNFHAGSKGIILFERAGGAYQTTLAIDTSKLAPGPHKLVIRADAKANLGTGTNGTNSGVIVIPFLVGG